MVYVMANDFNKTNVLLTGKEGTGKVTMTLSGLVNINTT
jgi:hypothetical protein